MTTTEILQIITAMINHTDTSQPGSYGVYVTNKQLHCQPTRKRQPDDRLVVGYSRVIVEKGATPNFWNRLENIVRGLQQEGLL